jgi:21S rRNA (GM2251-2'-O)-methyltransferase
MKLTDIKDKKLCVYLDQITDPQNFGAIIRSCYYFQISCLLVAAKNRCPLNSTVSKTSSGALELINIHSVADSVGFIQKWK